MNGTAPSRLERFAVALGSLVTRCPRLAIRFSFAFTTLYQVRGSNRDLGLLAEFLYDGRAPNAPVTVFDRDVFVGLRWAFNDLQDTSILMAAIIDAHDGSGLVSVEAERRVGQRWRLEFESRGWST